MGRKGKVGVKEKVEEILARRCSIGRTGRVLWEGMKDED